MPKATITYTPTSGPAYVFTTQGATLYGSDSVYEADAPDGIPRRRRTTYTLRQLFTEDSFADNSARIGAMREALESSEGVLLITDENGTTLVNARVRAMGDSVPLDWRQYSAIPEVKFSGLENLAAATVWDATFTPTGGVAVSLPAVKLFKGDAATEYYNTMSNARAEGLESVFMEGTFRADPALTPEQRRAWLLAQISVLETAVQSAPDGLLVFGDYSKTVRVLQLTFPAGDLTDEASWMLSAQRRWLPGDATAHASFKLTTKDDLDAATRTVTITGTIKALDETAAILKRNALRDSYLTVGRMLVDQAWEEARANGADGAQSLRVWEFSYSLRQVLPGAVVRATLSIQETVEYETGIITSTYSGSVTATTSAAALLRARDWSAIYPWKISSSETVNSVSEGSPATTDIFSGVEFSYTYKRRGTEVRAMVMDETSRQHFGESTRTVSGTAIAPTESAALALAASFKPAGVLMLTEVTGKATDYPMGTAAVFKQVTFSYTCHVGAQDFTLDYQKQVKRDLKKGVVTTSYSGTAWATTEAECDRAINALVAAMANITMDERGVALRSRGVSGGAATEYLMSKTFAVTDESEDDGDGSGSEDGKASEKHWAIESTYSHDHVVLTPIPGADKVAHVQTGCGIVPGTRVVTGSIKNFALANALLWARDKKPIGGHKTLNDQDQETVDRIEKPSPKTYVVKFRYSRTYPNLQP